MDDRTFRRAMGHFATGVTIITTKVDEGIHGMTENAFMSVSLDPKLVAISIDNRANIINKIDSSQKFAVSLLNAIKKICLCTSLDKNRRMLPNVSNSYKVFQSLLMN